jgi:hypothetical protein
MPLNYNTMTALTRHKYIPVLADNVYKSNGFFLTLDSQDRILEDGGDNIHEPLLMAQQPSQWFQGYDSLNITPVDPIRELILNWKLAMSSVTIDIHTLRLNSGSERVLSVLESLMENSTLTLKDQLGVASYADGVTNTLMPEGIQCITGGTNGLTPDSYGGLSRSANTWWQSQFQNMNGAQPTFTLLQTMYGSCTQGDTSPNLILCDQITFNKLWAQALPMMRVEAGDEVLIGWQYIKFNRAKILVDSHNPAGNVYFLNTQFLKIIVHRDENFDFTGWMPALTQHAMTGRVHWMGNLICNNLRFQGAQINYSVT